MNHRDVELASFHLVPRSFSARMLISAVLWLIVIVKLVEADSTACDCAAGSIRSQAWPYLPAVARLP